VRHSNSPPSNTESSQSPEQRTLDSESSHTSPNDDDNRETAAHEPIDDIKIALGNMKISGNGKVTYTSGNSWNTILDEIADIKLALNPLYSSWTQNYKEPLNPSPMRPSSFPFFAATTPSIIDLLALLPTRTDMDLLVQKFCQNMLTMCPALHLPTFQRDLKGFYDAPEAVDPIFLGTLFACLACGISVYPEDAAAARNILMNKGVATKKEMACIWRDASMQAFCLGGFLMNTTLENIQVLSGEG